MEESSLIQALQNPQVYEHPITECSVIETHISWVILTGPFAYKIKKPVKFDFLDFETLEKRHHYCQEELRLNQRLAPELYLEVLPIYGTVTSPTFRNNQNSSKDLSDSKNLKDLNKIIEYAIKMHQFDQDCLLSNMIIKNQVTESMIADLATQLSDFHQQADKTDTKSPFGDKDRIKKVVMDNFTSAEDFLNSYQNSYLKTYQNSNEQENLAKKLEEMLGEIKEWSLTEFLNKQGFITLRKSQGFVRHCHGDLHLGNMVHLNNLNKKISVFDCIEFNLDFEFIDVMNEIAFLLMDLEFHQHPELAYYFLNQYLEKTGDFEGVVLLDFYKVYRAMVRAKIALTLKNHNSLAVFSDYLSYIEKIIQPKKPCLIITFGLSGSGKTFYARNLACHLAAIHVRSDVERKRLFNQQIVNEDMNQDKQGNNKIMNQDMNQTINADLYSPTNTKITYERLFELAQLLILNGERIIIDAAFLKHQEREKFKILASKYQIPFVIIEFTASKSTLTDRILERLRANHDASDATPEVLERQYQFLEPLTATEKQHSIQLNTDDSNDSDDSDDDLIKVGNEIINFKQLLAMIDTKIDTHSL